MRRSWSEVNFVGRVKSTACTRRLRTRRRRAPRAACPPCAASTSAAIASALMTLPPLMPPPPRSVDARPPPASRTDTVPVADVDAHRCGRATPPTASAHDRACAAPATSSRDGRRVALRRPRAPAPRRRTCSRRRPATACRKHARGAALDHPVDQRGHRVVGELVQRLPASACPAARAARCAPARRRRPAVVHERQPDARAQPEGDQHVAGGRRRSRARPCAPSSPSPPARAERPSSSPTPSSVGTSMNAIEQSEPSTAQLGVEHQRHVAGVRPGRPAPTATIAPSMSVAVAGGVGLDRDARSSPPSALM